MSTDDILETFRTEASEHLAALEKALLEMENQPDDLDLIAVAFRAMHTIKGTGGMFGYDHLTSFTHHLESTFDKIRNGESKVTAELISIMLDAKDHIQSLLLFPEATSDQQKKSEHLLSRLHHVIPLFGIANPKAMHVEEDKGTPHSRERVLRIRFTPDRTTFRFGLDPLTTIAQLKALGNLTLTTGYQLVPPLPQLLPEECYLNFDAILVTTATDEQIEDIFTYVADDWTIHVETVDIGDKEDSDGELLGEILVERGLVSKKQVDAVFATHLKTGQLLEQAGLVQTLDIEAALAEQKVIRKAKSELSKSEVESFVRVPASKLDTLMNLVGELVITQARMNQLAIKRQDEELHSASEDLDRLTTELRDNTFSIRLLPIGSTFGRFKRLVRDLSNELGKKITLETEGAETELDKVVLDNLADPLIHLIRNSIDHGIESPSDREKKGKPATGTIKLSARHAGSHVLIDIEDDGAGLNSKRILEKAIERGLVRHEDNLSEQEIQNLIFEAGFSTAQTVSDISGRGVGMDVVKRSIHVLGGEVSIESTDGVGTKFRIRLPLTLAIIEGLMVSVAKEHYVLPLNQVEECVELFGKGSEHNSSRLLSIRGEQIPYMRLREWFKVNDTTPEIEQIVVLRLGEERFGFCVDEVIGQYQTVIKQLGKLYEGVVGFSGATILGDGGVAIILDAMALMESSGAASKWNTQQASRVAID